MNLRIAIFSTVLSVVIVLNGCNSRPRGEAEPIPDLREPVSIQECSYSGVSAEIRYPGNVELSEITVSLSRLGWERTSTEADQATVVNGYWRGIGVGAIRENGFVQLVVHVRRSTKSDDYEIEAAKALESLMDVTAHLQSEVGVQPLDEKPIIRPLKACRD